MSTNQIATTEQAEKTPPAKPGPVAQLTERESDFSLIQRQAAALAKSDLIPVAYKNNLPNCILALDISQRLGIQPLAVCQNLHVIQGRPSWSSTFVIAMLNASGRFSPLRFETRKSAEKETAWRAVATCRETGNILEGPWVTLEMAKAEGWSTKGGSKWVSMPELMGRYRAAAFFGRLYAPEKLMGLQHVEELEDMRPMKRAGSDAISRATAALAAPSDAIDLVELPPDAELASNALKDGQTERGQ